MVHWVPVLADSQTTVRLRLKTRVSLDLTSDRPRYGVRGDERTQSNFCEMSPPRTENLSLISPDSV